MTINPSSATPSETFALFSDDLRKNNFNNTVEAIFKKKLRTTRCSRVPHERLLVDKRSKRKDKPKLACDWFGTLRYGSDRE